ncbi:hypothetical protein [Marinilabilia sp.]|nr:hypothetical protein [Marinilabilia sp.]
MDKMREVRGEVELTGSALKNIATTMGLFDILFRAENKLKQQFKIE